MRKARYQPELRPRARHTTARPLQQPATDGSEKKKENILYKPGDRFIVNDTGWLIRMNPEEIEARKAQEQE